MTSSSELPSRFSNWSYHDFNLGWVFGRQNPAPGRRKSTASSIENGEVKGFNADGRKGDPLYWPRSRKLLHCILPACVAFNCTLGATIITPATATIQADLNTTDISSNLFYTVYIAGIGAGALLGGPATAAFGRKPTLLAALSALALSFLGAALSRTALELATLRGLAGAFSGAALLAGAAALSDAWRPRQRALANLALAGALLLGQAPGSIAGRLIVDGDGKSWRWTQAVPALAAVPLLLLALLARETSPATGRGRAPRAWRTLRRTAGLLVRPSVALLGVWAGAALGAVLALLGAATAAPAAPAIGALRAEAVLAPLAPLADDVGVGAIAAGTLFGLLAHLLHLVLVHGPLASRWASRRGASSAAPEADGNSGGVCGGDSGSSSARTSVVDIALEPAAPPTTQRRPRGEPSSPPPHYRLLAALLGTVALPTAVLVIGLTARPRGASFASQFVPLTFVALLAAGAALAFVAGLEYLMDAFEDGGADRDADGDAGACARVAVVAAYVGIVFAVAGGLAVGLHVGERAVGVKVVFGGLAAGLALLGCGVWGLWFFGRRAARK